MCTGYSSIHMELGRSNRAVDMNIVIGGQRSNHAARRVRDMKQKVSVFCSTIVWPKYVEDWPSNHLSFYGTASTQ